ncbi:unnamed protein product [Paramecium sonneborni]|uniref:Uncharacterized protein n=1 Tax=Paramecium sonneborni TaxID=65129 RepID=A0A8S1KHX8_9CILI|nr:unnamed protein product [Paramecium sonneborni]
MRAFIIHSQQFLIKQLQDRFLQKLLYDALLLKIQIQSKNTCISHTKREFRQIVKLHRIEYQSYRITDVFYKQSFEIKTIRKLQNYTK